MSKLHIYCTSIKHFSVIDKMPKYITGLALSENYFPNNWLNDSFGQNIRILNKHYGELTGFYWIWKNRLNYFKNKDLIGFCHYRKFWLNDKNLKREFRNKSLYSILLNEKKQIFNSYDAIQVNPIVFKNRNLLEDFSLIHGREIIYNCLNFFDKNIKRDFINHLNNNVLFPLNMFITKKNIFNDYCEVLFPWLERCMSYFKEEKILSGYNIRLPAFITERFTSFWFNQIRKKTTLPYARLGNFFLSNRVNKFINPLKLPFTSKMYPTIHKY